MVTVAYPNRYRNTAQRPAMFIIMHTSEQAMDGNAADDAEQLENFFKQKGTLNGGQYGTAYHRIHDIDSTRQIVDDHLVPYAQGGANNESYSQCWCGKAGVSRAVWLERLESKGGIEMAQTAAQWCLKDGITPVKLTPEQIRDRSAKGLGGHGDVSKYHAASGGHTDPGPSFPWDVYIQKVKFWVDAVGQQVLDDIDMSHWQDVIDFSKVPEVLGMTHKACEIKMELGPEKQLFVDPRLVERWTIFRERKVKYRGHWLFLRSDSPIEAQVALYLGVIDELGGLQLGEYCILDWEPRKLPDGTTLPYVTPTMLNQAIALIERRWGKRWLVYTYMYNPGFFEWRAANSDAPLQLAHYGTDGLQQATRFGAALHQFKIGPVPGFSNSTMQSRILRSDVLDRITQSSSKPIIKPPVHTGLIPPKDPDMKHIYADNRSPTLVGPGFVHVAKDDEDAWVMTRQYGPAEKLNDREYDVSIEQHSEQVLPG